MSRTAGRDERVLDLVREAARWRLAGLLLRRPRPGRRAEIEALAREAGDAALDRAVAAVEPSEGPYLGLLGPGGPVSPRECSYRPIEDPGRLLAEIASFHRAFDYRGSGEDPGDHVAVAADFAGYLALKEAYARDGGRDGDADTTREARERFVGRHVRALARGMGRRLDSLDGAPERIAAAVAALYALAGAGPEDDPVELDAAPFLRAGLDGATFPCGAVDGDAPDACAGDCPWPEPGSPDALR